MIFISTRRRSHWRLVAGLGLLALVVLAVAVERASKAAGQGEAASALPKTVTATKMKPDRSPFRHRGAVVSASTLGNRVFVNRRDGFALANLKSGGGTTYPASTVNGGRTWRIDGPHFWVAAADAPDVMTQVGAVAPRTYFAFGGPAGGTTVAVTTDRGRRWWRASLPGQVFAVVGGLSKLYAFIGVRGAYVSRDGGRLWHYVKSL